MAFLLDVNALIALVDTEHVAHLAAQEWFLRRHTQGWATCPITENGMVRVLSQPSYPSGQRSPAEVLEILRALKNSFQLSHEFWADDISISDDSVFNASLIAGAKQVTDVYLLGLAVHNKGTFVSFDRSLAWRAIRGATPELVEALPAQLKPDLPGLN